MVNIINSNAINVTLDRKGHPVAKVFNRSLGKFFEIKLDKATFLSSYKTLIGYVKVTAKANDTSKYYINIKKVAEATGLSPSTIKGMDRNKLQNWILQLQAEPESVIKNEVPTQKTTLVLPDEATKMELSPEEKEILGDIQKEYKCYNGLSNQFDRIEKLVSKHAISAQKLKETLDEIKNKPFYSLADKLKAEKNPDQIQRIPEIQRIFDTLFNAAVHWEERRESTFYHEKVHRIDDEIDFGKHFIKGINREKTIKDLISYSYMFDKEGHLSIFRDPFIGGTSKQFAQIYEFSNSGSTTRRLKAVIRGNVEVKNFFKEQEMKEGLDSPYIHNPEIEEVANYTKEKGGVKYKKYIYLEEALDSDGLSIPFHDIKAIIQFCFDYGSGLAYLHEYEPKPIVHCDGKPENGLRIGNRAKVCDFGHAIYVDDVSKGGTEFYVPYEFEAGDKTTIKYDSYLFGLVILTLLDNAESYCKSQYDITRFYELNPDQRLEFFEHMKEKCEKNERLKSDWKFDKPIEENMKIPKLKLIELVERLTKVYPKEKRLSCREAIEEIKKLAEGIEGIDFSEPVYKSKKKKPEIEDNISSSPSDNHKLPKEYNYTRMKRPLKRGQLANLNFNP